MRCIKGGSDDSEASPFPRNDRGDRRSRCVADATERLQHAWRQQLQGSGTAVGSIESPREASDLNVQIRGGSVSGADLAVLLSVNAPVERSVASTPSLFGDFRKPATRLWNTRGLVDALSYYGKLLSSTRSMTPRTLLIPPKANRRRSADVLPST